MKTTKTIFAIGVSIAMMIIALCGCGETSENQINAEQSNDVEFDVSEPIEDKEDEVEADKEVERCVTFIPLSIKVNRGLNFKDEVIKHIENSKTQSREYEYYELYQKYTIEDIKEFYSLDNLIIDGYQLYSFYITKGSFSYNFVPIEGWDNEYVIALDIGVIRIGIYRPDWSDEADPLKSTIEQAEEQGWGYLTEDDMVYSPIHGDISARIGDTSFGIRVPQELNSYEYLRDLAFKVIETAESVVVGE